LRKSDAHFRWALSFTAVEELTHNKQTKTRKKSKMAAKKTKKNPKDIKVRDLKPRKDVKGGTAPPDPDRWPGR